MYSSAAYFLSKTLVEVPLMGASTALVLLITYLMENLQGSFFLLWLTLWAVGLAASSFALLISVSVNSPEKAIGMVDAIFVPQILFTGLLRDERTFITF